MDDVSDFSSKEELEIIDSSSKESSWKEFFVSSFVAEVSSLPRKWTFNNYSSNLTCSGIQQCNELVDKQTTSVNSYSNDLLEILQKSMTILEIG